MDTTKALLIHQLSLEEFESLLSGIIEEKIGSLYESSKTEENPGYWTRDETARYLNISLPTLSAYTKKGIIKGYRIEGLIRYRRSEIDASLEEITTTKNKRIR